MTIHIEITPVSNEDEALTFMLHHLRLAAAYFEGTPKHIPSAAWENDFSAPAITKWLDGMEALYPED